MGNIDGGIVKMRCETCLATGPLEEDSFVAGEAWNERVSEDKERIND
jgi:hypothetical protein